MTSGSHHLIIFFDSTGYGPAYDCGGLEFGERLHGAQVPEYVREYPEGVAMPMYATEGLRFNMHYLNPAADKPLTAKVKLTILAAPAGTAEHKAGFLLFNNMGIDLAPRSQGTATKTCSMPPNVQVMDLVSHMHMRGTDFLAQTGAGKVIYQSSDWDHPTPTIFTPPLGLGNDVDITWTCSYNNTSGNQIGFGQSAATNEMCILGGTFYPAGQRSYLCL
jgi:hypothetical protein